MENNKHRILLIEPSQIVSTGLSSLIEQTRDFTIVSSLQDLTYYDSSRSMLYDIILINPMVVDFNKRSNIRALLTAHENKAIVAISYNLYEEKTLNQYNESISILDSKENIVKKLKHSIQEIEENPATDNKSLSARERDIVTAVAQGKTNKEIASDFNLSIHTIITHRKNISNKLGINTISGLTVYAILNKLIDARDLK